VNRLEAALGRLLERLADYGVPHAVVGGLAVSARTEPRFTRDADICVAVAGDLEAEAVIRHLGTRGYLARTLVEQEAAGRIAAVRLVTESDDDGMVLDLLFASSGIEAEVVEGSEMVELVEGLRAPIATISALIALKVLSRDDASRPQDRVDLVALLQASKAEDISEAQLLLGLIQERGYSRGRDLLAGLTAIREEVRT
jgi:hypothetical protein